MAHDWFADNCCLFIFDDVWRSNDIGENILLKLSVDSTGELCQGGVRKPCIVFHER